MTRIDAILKLVKGPDVLHVGCTGHDVESGSEDWLHGRLVTAFPNTAGIDISAANLQTLATLGYHRLHHQSAESMQLPDRFDTIVAGELIEHLSNPGLFLERACAHLKPGGQLIVTTPSPFALLNTLYAFVHYPRTCQNLEHTCWFCPQTMRTLAERYHLVETHFQLIADYRANYGSRPYRVFVRMSRILGPMLPARLIRNTMLFVFVPRR
jgi:2-polyprenyl-3-methyl-5-hydroxy-6-metoxy-1,4-benzoquinol methylase